MQAAQELPSAARRAWTRSSPARRPTPAFREALIADLEAALAREGYEPHAAGCSTSCAGATRRTRSRVGSAREPRRRRARGQPDEEYSELPAWSLPKDAVGRIALPAEWPERVTREWAWGGATGKGVRVCILDSGVDQAASGGRRTRERRRDLRRATTRTVLVEEDTGGRSLRARHGLRRDRPLDRARVRRCTSVRVLGAGFTGTGPVLLGGLRYAVEQGFDVINMSLSTTKKQFAGMLHELADSAYFKRSVLVASAHNMPVESYPWKFSSVHLRRQPRGGGSVDLLLQPEPPVEFFGRGVDVEVAWLGGATINASGQQLRDAASRRDLRADPEQASGADAVPAQERAVPDGVERRGWEVTGQGDELRAAVAAGVVGSGDAFRELLAAIVEVARQIFRARGLVDPPARRGGDELVFEAVAGEGEQELIGLRFPAGTGIAGWVLSTRTPLDPRRRPEGPALREGRRGGTPATCLRA